MTQPRPEFNRVEEEADNVLAALGLSSAEAIIRSTAGGTTHVLVATSQPIDQIDPDTGRVTQVSLSLGAHTLVPFRANDDSTLHARVFASAVGVAEDPGSGSAAGPIGLLARQLWGMRADVTVSMGAEIGRPSRIEVRTADDIQVGGRVIVSADGHFLV